jgi:hypothetical protein
MSYIGNQPTSVAFLTDQFSGTGSQTAFTLSAAPANTASIIVAVSGVLQDPTTYSTSGLTLTFSAAPPVGTGNISVRFLGIPASNIATTAYRTQTEFTATAGQTTFSVPSYTVGYIDVYRNGALLGSADFTASNGTTVVLTNAASSGDLIETISFFVSSVLNAIPATTGAVTNAYLLDGSITKAKMAASGAWAPTGTVIQVVQGSTSTQTSTTSQTYSDTTLTASITPTSATSKILVMVNQQYRISRSSSGSFGGLRLLRGATTIVNSVGDSLGPYSLGISVTGGTFVQIYNTWSTQYLDSPATTSATTYKTQFATYDGISNFTCQINDTTSSSSYIQLLEIAG